MFVQIFAKIGDAIRPVTLEIDPCDKVSYVKERVLEEIEDSLLVDSFRYLLIYKGERAKFIIILIQLYFLLGIDMELDDECILADYGVKDWEILHFISMPECLGNSSPYDSRDNDSPNEEQVWWRSTFEAFLRQICVGDDAYEEVPLFGEQSPAAF